MATKPWHEKTDDEENLKTMSGTGIYGTAEGRVLYTHVREKRENSIIHMSVGVRLTVRAELSLGFVHRRGSAPSEDSTPRITHGH